MYSSGQKLLIVIFSMLVLGMFFFSAIDDHDPTASVVARGGQVTRADLFPSDRFYWGGIYGDITQEGVSHVAFNVHQPALRRLNLKLSLTTKRIFASRGGFIGWEGVMPAEPYEIDLMDNLASSDPLSATKIFTNQKEFLIGGRTYLLYYATLNSYSGQYLIAVLKHNNSILFMTETVDNGRAFDNTPAQYQMMLPVQPGENITYYFFSEPASIGSDAQNTGTLAITPIPNIHAYQQRPYSIGVSAYYENPGEGNVLLDASKIEFFTVPGRDWITFDSCYNELFTKYCTMKINPPAGASGDFLIDVYASDKGKYVVDASTPRTGTTVSIGRCGDTDMSGRSMCDSRYEDCSSCPLDCGACSSSNDYMVMQIDDSYCLGKLSAQFYDTTKNFPCEGNKDIFGRMSCSTLGDVEVTVYRLEDVSREISMTENMQWISYWDGNADPQGKIELDINAKGRYLAQAMRQGYAPYYHYLDVDECHPAPAATQPPIDVIIDEKPSGEEKKPIFDEPTGFATLDIVEYKGYIFAAYALALVLVLFLMHKYFEKE